jgi:hypothetical protein
MQTRCQSVFDNHSSCAFFQDRCVATESTVNFAPLLRAYVAPCLFQQILRLSLSSNTWCFSFSCPVFLRHSKARASAPKASGCILGGTQRNSGRNRESRRREAAGRRNWPEAVPRRMSGGRSALTEHSDNQRTGSGLEIARVTRNARLLADRHASPVAQGCSTTKQQLLSTA